MGWASWPSTSSVRPCSTGISSGIDTEFLPEQSYFLENRATKPLVRKIFNQNRLELSSPTFRHFRRFFGTEPSSPSCDPPRPMCGTNWWSEKKLASSLGRSTGEAFQKASEVEKGRRKWCLTVPFYFCGFHIMLSSTCYFQWTSSSFMFCFPLSCGFLNDSVSNVSLCHGGAYKAFITCSPWMVAFTTGPSQTQVLCFLGACDLLAWRPLLVDKHLKISKNHAGIYTAIIIPNLNDTKRILLVGDLLSLPSTSLRPSLDISSGTGLCVGRPLTWWTKRARRGELWDLWVETKKAIVFLRIGRSGGHFPPKNWVELFCLFKGFSAGCKPLLHKFHLHSFLRCFLMFFIGIEIYDRERRWEVGVARGSRSEESLKDGQHKKGDGDRSYDKKRESLNHVAWRCLTRCYHNLKWMRKFMGSPRRKTGVSDKGPTMTTRRRRFRRTESDEFSELRDWRKRREEIYRIWRACGLLIGSWVSLSWV